MNLSKSVENINIALQHYRSLQANWDDEGAAAPAKVDLQNADNFFELIVSNHVDLPSVFLSREGEINFIWKYEDSPLYIDIGFIDGTYSVYAVHADNEKFLRSNVAYDKEELLCLLGLLKQKINYR